MLQSGVPIASRSQFSLTPREQSRYSIARAILAAAHEADGGLYRSANSFELEVSREVERSLPSNVKKHGGILVPYGTWTRAGLDSKTVTQATSASPNRREK